jgi:hypothetical protein
MRFEMDYVENFLYGLWLGAKIMVWFLLLAIVAFPETVGTWRAQVDNAYDKARIYNVEVE